MERQKKHIILLGASVGKAWKISEFQQRENNHDYLFEYTGLYKFDKSKAINELLSRSEGRPDAIILKECAAYFPSDLPFSKMKSLMKSWIVQCQAQKVVPIPATVVPVTPAHDHRFKTHNPIKRIVKRILGISMKTRMEKIIEYNDWIKNYVYEKNLVCLDLEAALRKSEINRFLREEYTIGDGLHLNAHTYTILDGLLLSALNKIEFYDNQSKNFI